jgi:lysophospholipase L1-like esterase
VPPDWQAAGKGGALTDRTILCFGDSNTHGTIAMTAPEDRRRHPRAARWPSVMAARLGAGWEVICEGLPGRTSVFDDPVEGAHKNGLRMLPGLLESHRPLDLVIVMLGTNDTKHRFAAPAGDIARGLERLALTIRQSGCGPDGAAPRVLLAAPVPVIETGLLAGMFEGAAKKSRALAPALREAAARQQAGFVDLAAVAEADPVDGIHLTAEAQAAIGAAMAAAVQDLFA